MCAQLGVTLTEQHYHLLIRYANLVSEWNRKINLISRKDIHRLFTYHIVDSLATAPLIPSDARCGDVGSGAGLPGIPLAIVRQDLYMFLIESVKRKGRFLQLALAELGLDNAQVLCERAEALQSLACDTILSRLTGPLPKTLEYTLPHLKPGGAIIFYKSPNVSAEIDEKLLRRLNLSISRTVDLILPLSAVSRRLLVLGRN